MRVIMTGATSGIGLVAARKLLEQGVDLVVGARRPDDAPADLKARATLTPLDLADLASVERFAKVAAALSPFDALVLNAGLQVTSAQTSAQGLELTFAANHLAHFLLIDRLVSGLGSGGRVVITSSGTHDPRQKTGMPPPLHADARKLAYPQTDRDRDAKPGTAGRRAYSTSKLCNVMTARELPRRLADTRPDVAAAAFDPAYVPATGLVRDYPAPARFIVAHVLPRLMAGRPWVSTPEVSGGYLADLASGAEGGSAHGDYFSVRALKLTNIAPSDLARDDAACARLWDDSRALLRELGHATSV